MATDLGSMSLPGPAATLEPQPPTGVDSPHHLLPAELLILTLALASPRSILPTASSSTLSVCADTRLVQIGWRNSILLGDLSCRPTKHSNQLQGTLTAPVHRSNLENMLKSLLPVAHSQRDCPATGIAPTRPSGPDPIFTPEYLRHLYQHTFLRPCAETRCPAPAHPQPGAAAAMLSIADAVFAPIQSDYNWWRPVTDGCLLPVYLIRAGQLDLLDSCLASLTGRTTIPNVPHLSLGMLSWSAISLDSRTGTRDMFEGYLLGLSTDHSVPYPLALATFALLEWSLPALEIILRRFPAVSPSAVAQQASRTVVSAMLSLLTIPGCVLPDNVGRIIDLYNWLDTLGVRGLRYPLTSVLVYWCREIEYVTRALVEFDIPYMNAAADLGTRETVRAGIMSTVKQCFSIFGDQVLLPIVVANGVMEDEDWAAYIAWSVDRLWPRVIEFVPLKEDRKSIAMAALRYALDQAGQRQSLTSSLTPGILTLADLLHDDFGVDLLDVMLNNDLELADRQVNTFFITLHNDADAARRIDPAAALARTLTYIETTASTFLLSDIRTHALCSMAALFYYFICFSGDPSSVPVVPELDLIQNVSPSQLAILTTAIIVAHSLADKVMLDFLPVERPNAAIESLVAHTHQVFQQRPDSLSTRFFDQVTPSLRATVAAMIRELVSVDTPVVLDVNQHDRRYCAYPAHVKWILTQLVQLDSQFVAAATGPLWNDSVIDCARELVSAQDQACAKASWGIVDLVMRGELEQVAVYWQSVARSASTAFSRQDVVRMTQWMAEAEEYSDREGSWRSHEVGLQDRVGEVVVQLFVVQ